MRDLETLTQQYGAVDGALQAEMTFDEAARVYCRIRVGLGSDRVASARLISPFTEKMHQRFSRSLGLFFGKSRLADVRPEHLRAYQLARLQGAEPFVRARRPQEAPAPCPCKAAQVNQEMCFFRAVLRRAGAWTSALDGSYMELREEQAEVPRALSAQEQMQWLTVARRQPRWQLVLWYSLLAFDTGMSTNELRGLRIGDVDLEHRVIHVPWASAKNKYRHRTIVIESAETLWALGKLLGRAAELGASSPQHYLFPLREKAGCYAPEQPMSSSGLKKLWNEVREASGLGWFRPYDTRHTAITRLAEHGIPAQVISARAGHVSDRMSQHYTHISLAAQRHWMIEAAQPRADRRKGVAAEANWPAQISQRKWA